MLFLSCLHLYLGKAWPECNRASIPFPPPALFSFIRILSRTFDLLKLLMVWKNRKWYAKLLSLVKGSRSLPCGPRTRYFLSIYRRPICWWRKSLLPIESICFFFALPRMLFFSHILWFLLEILYRSKPHRLGIAKESRKKALVLKNY